MFIVLLVFVALRHLRSGSQPIRSSINRLLNSDSSAHSALAVKALRPRPSVARAESCSAAADDELRKEALGPAVGLGHPRQAFDVGGDCRLDTDTNPVQDFGDDGEGGVLDRRERDHFRLSVGRDEPRGVLDGGGQLGVHGVQHVELLRADPRRDEAHDRRLDEPQRAVEVGERNIPCLKDYAGQLGGDAGRGRPNDGATPVAGAQVEQKLHLQDA